MIRITVKDIERDVLIQALFGMKNKTIDIVEARQMAREFLAAEPFANIPDCLEKLYSLSEKYVGIRKVFLKYAKWYGEQKREEITNQAHEYIKRGDVSGAIEQIKGGLNYGSV